MGSSSRSSHSWLARYGIRAIQMQPLLPFPLVVQRAVACYPYCFDLAPERAAEMHADPQRTAKTRTSASTALRQRFHGDVPH